MSNKMKVGVLGATGAVGQRFVTLLEDHPWFELTELAASDRSAGKSYKEAAVWRQYKPIPERLKATKVKPCEPTLDCRACLEPRLIVRGRGRGELRACGLIVLNKFQTSSKCMRMSRFSFLKLNPEHLALIKCSPATACTGAM